MSSGNSAMHETILKLCAQSGAQPWYPGAFAASMGIDKSKLDGPLDDLRLAGLIEFTPWQANQGQGFRITPEGRALLDSPRGLDRLRGGKLPKHELPDLSPADERLNEPSNLGYDVRRQLSAGGRPIVTYAIVGLNVLNFLAALMIAQGNGMGFQAFVLGGNRDARHLTGGLLGADLLHGDWWRILTTIFVHRDAFHLLINMVTFTSYGVVSEKMWGRGRYLVIYLLAGVASVCATLVSDPTVAPMGASGSLCGVLLSQAAWLFLNRKYMPSDVYQKLIRQVGMAFVWWMVWMGLFGWAMGLKFWWVGHVAGAVTGVIVSVLLHLQQHVASPIRWSFLLLVAVVPVVCVGLVIRSKGTDLRWREQAKAAIEVDEKRETKEFEEKILPDISARWRANEVLLRKIGDWVEGERPNAPLAEADREALTKARRESKALADKLAALPPGKGEIVRTARETAERLMTKYDKLFELLERKVRLEQPWKEEDQNSLEAALNLKENALNDWKKKLK